MFNYDKLSYLKHTNKNPVKVSEQAMCNQATSQSPTPTLQFALVLA